MSNNEIIRVNADVELDAETKGLVKVNADAAQLNSINEMAMKAEMFEYRQALRKDIDALNVEYTKSRDNMNKANDAYNDLKSKEMGAMEKQVKKEAKKLTPKFSKSMKTLMSGLVKNASLKLNKQEVEGNIHISSDDNGRDIFQVSYSISNGTYSTVEIGRFSVNASDELEGIRKEIGRQKKITDEIRGQTIKKQQQLSDSEFVKEGLEAQHAAAVSSASKEGKDRREMARNMLSSYKKDSDKRLGIKAELQKADKPLLTTSKTATKAKKTRKTRKKSK